MASYTVAKGDCLWTIAEKKLGSGLRWTDLAKLNGISLNNPIIYPGQVISLDVTGGGIISDVNTSNQPIIQYFGLQAGTDTTIFITWSWSKDNTDNYRVVWYYDTGDKVWFVGSDSTENFKQSVYSAPANAKNVKVKVMPISTMHKVNDKDVHYWTASWSTEKKYNFSNNPPKVPSVPTIKIEEYTLTTTLDDLDINATEIQFQIVKNNASVFNTGTAKIKTTSTSYSCMVTAGGEYKVRARGCRNDVYGDWSDYSGSVGTIPAASDGFKTVKALSETSVYLDWVNVKNCDSYYVEWTTEERYFDSSPSMVKSMSVESVVGHAEITGMESGTTYFFRVRAVNTQGHSAWCDIRSITIGKIPAAPTTWSSSTTVITGEPLTLYWVHNTEDGSSQTYAEVQLTINGVTNTYTIANTTDEDEKDKTSFYEVKTSSYIEGTKIQWRVRTAGVTRAYGDWSIQRVVDIYAPPTVELNILNLKGESFDVLKTFPFYVSALAGPKTQRPIGYHLVISSSEMYETIDNVGNVKIVNRGEQVYSKHFDVSDTLMVVMSASNVDLENNIRYIVTCSVSMNSGLTATSSVELKVAWTDVQYSPDAEIGVDPDMYTTYIRPYCQNEIGELIKDVSLSVYRREFDGTFTELAVGLNNTANTFITDPHPSLDYARYRILAVTTSTGAVSYYDPPGYPIGEEAVIIQWDEQWTSFDATSESTLEQPPWSGSLLRLPYNIDVSNNYGLDVSLVEYIGRQHPVSYYGTQIGETASWSMEVEKTDEETVYALRRLARWMGDIYIREPSGTGYWASVSVSFSQTHCELTIPVTLSITRVEGGM